MPGVGAVGLAILDDDVARVALTPDIFVHAEDDPALGRLEPEAYRALCADVSTGGRAVAC